MNVARQIDALERFAAVLPAAVRGVSDADARWKPDDGAWSILEIVMHLCDEEVDDFRARVRSTLDDAGREWPPIHPSQWAIDRKYNEADLNQAVDRFVRERLFSVEWLRSLPGAGVNWSTAHAHPKFGPLHAGDLLSAWAAHDALHLRQIAKRMHQLAKVHAGKFKIDYAGEWGA